jgi:thiol-disulfide isomerase/thioredoxin
MDRLPSVILGALALVGVGACDDGASAEDKPAEGRSRVDVVQASKPKIDIAGFCDVQAAEGQGKKLVMPELRSGAAPARGGGWQWVNVWATWCKPCVEELPMLESLRSKFASDQLPLSLVFLSVDAGAEEVGAFEAKHGKIDGGLQIKDANALPAWLTSVGLDENTALPIHFFVDETNTIRCVRMGAVNEGSYETVKGIVRQG